MPRLENLAEFLPPGADARALAEFVRARRNRELRWEDIAWMKQQWRGPLVAKGG